MLSLENKNTKENGFNSSRNDYCSRDDNSSQNNNCLHTYNNSHDLNKDLRLKDKLSFTLNPYTLVNNHLRRKLTVGAQFGEQFFKDKISTLIASDSAVSYDNLAEYYLKELFSCQECLDITINEATNRRFNQVFNDGSYLSSPNASFAFTLLDYAKDWGSVKAKLIHNYAHFMLDKGDFTPLSTRYNLAKDNAHSADERALAVILVSHLLQELSSDGLKKTHDESKAKDSFITENLDLDQNTDKSLCENKTIDDKYQDDFKFIVDTYGLSKEGLISYLQFLYIFANRSLTNDLLVKEGLNGKFLDKFGLDLNKDTENLNGEPQAKDVEKHYINLEEYLFKTKALHDIILFVNEIKAAIEANVSESELCDLISSKKLILLKELLAHRKDLSRSSLYVLRLVRDCLELTYLLQGNDASIKANRLFNYLSSQDLKSQKFKSQSSMSRKLKAKHSVTYDSYEPIFDIRLAYDYIKEDSLVNQDYGSIENTALDADLLSDKTAFTKESDCSVASPMNVNSLNHRAMGRESGNCILSDALYDIPLFRAFILKKMVLLSKEFKDSLNLFLSVHGTGCDEFESFMHALSSFDFIFNDPELGKLSGAKLSDEKSLGKNLLFSQYEEVIHLLKTFYKLIEHTVDILKDNTTDDYHLDNHDVYYCDDVECADVENGYAENDDIVKARAQKAELENAQRKEKALNEALLSIAAFMRSHYLPYGAAISTAYKKLVYCMATRNLPLMRIDGFKGKESLYPSYVIDANKSALNALHENIIEPVLSNLKKQFSLYETPSYLVKDPDLTLGSSYNTKSLGKAVSLEPLMTVYDKQLYRSLNKSAYLKYLCATSSMEGICYFIDNNYKVGNCEDALIILDCLHLYSNNYLKPKVQSLIKFDRSQELNLIGIALSFCVETAKVALHNNNGIYKSKSLGFSSYKNDEICELINSRLALFYFTHQYVFYEATNLRTEANLTYSFPVTEDAANVAYLVKALCEHDVKETLNTLELLPCLPGYTFIKSYLNSLGDKSVSGVLKAGAEPISNECLQGVGAISQNSSVFNLATVISSLREGKYGNLPPSFIYQLIVFYQLRQDKLTDDRTNEKARSNVNDRLNVKITEYAKSILKTLFFNSFYMPKYDGLSVMCPQKHKDPHRYDGEYFNEFSLLFTADTFNYKPYSDDYLRECFTSNPDYLGAVPSYCKVVSGDPESGDPEKVLPVRLSSRYQHKLNLESLSNKEQQKQKEKLMHKMLSHGIDPKHSNCLEVTEDKASLNDASLQDDPKNSFHIVGNKKLQDFLYENYIKDFACEQDFKPEWQLSKEFSRLIMERRANTIDNRLDNRIDNLSSDKKPMNLCLFGEHGSGKTKALEAMLRALNFEVHKINLATVAGSCVHEFGNKLNERFKEIDPIKPSVIVMENVDAYFPDVRYVRDLNDWTIEEVNATKLAIEDLEKTNCFVIMTAQFREKIDSGLLDLFPNTFDISRPLVDDIKDCFSSVFSSSMLPLSYIKKLSTILEGLSLNSIFKFIKMVKTELTKEETQNCRYNLGIQETVNALLKKFLGFTLDKDAVFSLPGQAELEKFINENFIDYIKDPKKYQRYNLNMLEPIMFYGAPGTGKTYAAGAIAKFLGWKLFTIDASQYEQYTSGSAKKINEIFNKAKDSAPSIVFIDEADSMFAKRSSNSNNEGISQFLRSISDTAKDRVLVIAATNRIDDMDEAILRNGRFSHKIEITYADTKSVVAVMNEYLKDIPVSHEISLIKAATKLSGHPLCDTKAFLDSVCKKAALRDSCKVEQCDVDEALLHLNLTKIEDNYSYSEATHKHKRVGFI